MDTLGAVTTHDLALADAEELKHECRPVHFTETIEVGGMAQRPACRSIINFGPVVAASTNALRLLDLMGIRDRHAPRQGCRKEIRVMPRKVAGG